VLHVLPVLLLVLLHVCNTTLQLILLLVDLFPAGISILLLLACLHAGTSLEKRLEANENFLVLSVPSVPVMAYMYYSLVLF